MSLLSPNLARFRVEADMLQPLAESAAALARNALTLFEIACTAGIPDMVLVVPDTGAVSDREGTSPLVEPVDVRLMVAVSAVRNPTARGWTLAELAEQSGVSAQHLRRVVVPRLQDGGHLTSVGERWAPVYRYRSLARRVVTVEAKLRDWRGAVGQASRHAAVADAAWVALDAASVSVPLANAHWFTTYGIGLLSVSTGGDVEKLILPGASRARQPGRELLVERAMALHQEGRWSGDIPMVFGQVLVASTGVDPRLAGAAAR